MFINIRQIVLLALAILGLGCGSVAQAVSVPRSIKPEPLFERNVGQYPESILYRGRLGHFDAGLHADGSLELARRARGEGSIARSVRIVPVGASAPREVRPEQRSEYRTNYFVRGDRESRDFTDVPHFGRVVYRALYEGIDLAYHFGDGRLEFDFIVAPGVDPGVIALQVDGANELKLDDQGDLLIASGAELIRHRRPVAYQVKYGTRIEVACAYRLQGNDRVTLALGPYDPKLELVVDPVVEYASYLGGAEWDESRAVRIGPGGFIYVTGRTISSKFPTLGAYDGAVSGVDVFVTKINPATGKLVYSTFIGGGSDDDPSAIAVDAQGAAYIVGMGRTRFPTTSGAYQTGSAFDGFVTKLAPAGNALAYSTFVFGTTPRAVEVDDSGQAVVTGLAGTAFVTSTNAFQRTYGGNGGFSDPREGDAFLLKMNATGTGVAFATFIGGPNSDDGNGVALDAAGRIVMVGFFSAPNSIPMVRPYMSTGSGGTLIAFESNGSSVTYSTNFPANLKSVAVDPFGNLVTVGTAGGDAPMVNAVLTPGQMIATGNLGGITKPVLAKFALRTNLELVFSTYYGSRYDCCEKPSGLAVDAVGDIFVLTEVDGSRVGGLVELHPFMSKAYTTARIPDPRYEAVVVTGFAREGGRMLFQTIATPCVDFSSVCSGTAWIHATGAGQVAVAGTTMIDWYPVAAANHQAASAGSDEVFVMAMALENPPLKLETSSTSTTVGTPLTLKATSYVPAASGTVEFLNGETLLGSVPMVEGVASLQVSLPAGIGRLSARLGASTAPPIFLPVSAVAGSCP